MLESISIFKKKSGSELELVTKDYLTTFAGVYVPTFLTILGLVMFLRLGWVVGNAGVLGALSMVLISFSLTGCTALAMSSIVTNVRLGSGGVFTLVSQSLGLEIGGSIGVPLYLAQSLSAPMYIYGVVEIWNYLYPAHDPFWVSIILYFIVFMISYVGAKIAFRVQGYIFVIVLVSVFTILLGYFSHVGVYRDVAKDGIEWWGQFIDGNYWQIFVIYFPSATGVLVGSSMSGNLRSPRKSIPKGTLLAWGTALFIVISMTIWYGMVGSTEVLRSNFNFSLENAFITQVAIAGAVSSCFTASLSSMIAGPRILQSMASYNLLPKSDFFGKTTNDEPRNAIFFTAAMSFILLIIFQDINLIAPFVTIFFIMIYFIVNGVLAVEQSLNLVSFRPELKLPRIVPIYGSCLALVIMFLISPLVGFISLAFIAGLYAYISRKDLVSPWETVQSGIFRAFAVWSVKKILMRKEKDNKRLWKPDILVPINSKNTDYFDNLRQFQNLLYTICAPQGSINFAYFGKNIDEYTTSIKQTEKFFHQKRLFVSSSEIKSDNFLTDLRSSLSIMRNSFFKPNSVFFIADDSSLKQVRKISQITTENKIAMLLFFPNEKTLGGRHRRKEIILWVRDQSPNWNIGLNLSNLDYGILLSYIIKNNWKANIRFICVTQKPENYDIALEFLKEITDLARMGSYVKIEAIYGKFDDVLPKYNADLHIFGFRDEITEKRLKEMAKLVDGSSLFVKDSGDGLESAIV